MDHHTALSSLLVVLVLSTARADTQPGIDLITRNFGAKAASSFELQIKDGPCTAGSTTVQPPCFALSQSNGKISVVASAMSELTYGIGWYTRLTCGLTVGWRHGGGSHTNSSNWPCTTSLSPVAMQRSVPYTYEDNVCTHSYSYVWYDQAAWVAHIDWMALQGVNVFLALTGQEEVQYKVFGQFGLKDMDIREFFNGPAYLTWSRGQSMQSVGSSASGLPRSWMRAQWTLQKSILKLARSLGIIGVLPGFQGNMPPQIKTLFPTANVSLTNPTSNQTKGNCAWVASTDPLFGKVADLWMQTLISDFGTDHWYQCDGFFLGQKPPWYEEQPRAPKAAQAVAWDGSPVQPDPNWALVWEAAWGGMSRTDPDAKWLYQGWAIREWSDAAGASRIKALYDAVPKGQWIPLDMDISGIWKYFGNYSFFGAPFIWTTLHNMGGNDGMKGDMRMLSGLPSAALTAGASIVGVGATPEGIDQNPPYYEYTFDSAWHASPQPLDAWFERYSSRRYGNIPNADAAAAWKIILSAVYNSQAGGWHDGTGVEWMLSQPPNPTGVNTTALFKAWGLLVSAGSSIHPEQFDTFNYDVVNVGREILAQLISRFESNLTTAVGAHDRAAALQAAGVLMDAYQDLDELVGCDYSFLLGPWIAHARSWANDSDAPASYYEWQARSQVSTWWPMAASDRQDPATYTKFPVLDNYANKHWNGLIRDFYAKRVLCYVSQVAIDLPSTPPAPAPCQIDGEHKGFYLKDYPGSLGSGGVRPPAVWPYNTSDLAAAQAWCCKHADCGGVTHQDGRFEVRAGSSLIRDQPDVSSFPRAGQIALNTTNITKCAVTAEMDFTQDVKTVYAQHPTNNLTLSLSSALLQKYGKYV
eukprot:TRINITY_DN15534_c0_g1_i1.p1 TRINITY_DN15534_c0_g1~~TRINITY_DN15534_c0_g1_i1.p1  ORF type:complete len:866 (+),score=187.31 TRINITY_DN15534_c0_g1_i1:142-2739(+)